MTEVKWIKLSTDIFDNRKIRQIEKLPDGDALVVIWLKLLVLAGNVNDGGAVYFTREIPYTDQLLSTQFGRPLATVQMALKVFQSFGMIEIIDDLIYISNWEKYQSADKLEQMREQNRIRQKRFYDKRKQMLIPEGTTCQYCGSPATGFDHIIPMSKGGQDTEDNKVPCCRECNRIKSTQPLVDFLNRNSGRIKSNLVEGNPKLSRYVTFDNDTGRYNLTQPNVMGCYNITQPNATDIDKELEEDKEKEKNKKIVEAWNATGFTKIRGIVPNSKRDKILQARIKERGEDTVLEAIARAKESSFLAGKNRKGWTITFDWFILPTNFQKVLEGNYDDRRGNDSRRDYGDGQKGTNDFAVHYD